MSDQVLPCRVCGEDINKKGQADMSDLVEVGENAPARLKAQRDEPLCEDCFDAGEYEA